MKTIGITGNIGSGKSQVTSYLLSRGYKVLDADKLVAEIYYDRNFILEMINLFGEQIVDRNPQAENELSLNKKAISRLVFEDERLLTELNELISPYINQKMKLQIAEYEKAEDILFLDIPLLFEKDMQKDMDKVILVYCDDCIRHKRAAERDCKPTEEIIRIDSFQMPQDKKLSLADYVIRNNGSIEYLHKEIDAVLENINRIKGKR